jgi:hypothetical protein
MKKRREMLLLTPLVLGMALLISGCSPIKPNDSYVPDETPPASSRLSEDEVIGSVKAFLQQASQPSQKMVKRMVTTPCSPQRAEYDSTCEPCAPGSSNFCVREWKDVPIEEPGSCPFPPSENAQWSADYDDYSDRWTVQSKDYMVTGQNSWTVDDTTGEILSGYCVYQ